MRLACVCVLGLTIAPAIARGDTVVPENEAPARFSAPAGQDIVITEAGERSTTNIAVLASVAGLGVALGGLGLYFHLDSRDKSNQVGTTVPTNKPWTPGDQTAYDQAHSSRTDAIIFYSLGGAALIGAVVALIVTEPKEQTSVIHPHVSLAPTQGGAVVGGMWRF